jgi:endonuclease G
MVFGGKFPTSSEPVTILCKKRFVIGYSIERKSPLWVAHVLTKEYTSAPKIERKNTFKTDPSLSKSVQSTMADYVGNEFDRGHMVPFEDVSDDGEAAKESFYLTNLVPQVDTNNRGIWKALEGQVRKLPETKNIIYVVTGPIFDEKFSKLQSGAHIPTRLFKLVLSPSTSEAYTVIIPNIGNLATSTMPLYFSSIANLRTTNKIINPLPIRGTFIDKASFKVSQTLQALPQ